MKKHLILLVIVSLFWNCSSDDIGDNDLLPNVPVNQTLYLNNPELHQLQIVGSWAYAQGGIAGIVVYRAGTNNFLAFERSAPHLAPTSCSKMTVKNNITMHCACDDSEFNLLNGSPLTEGISYSARQYRATLMGENTLQITNY